MRNGRGLTQEGLARLAKVTTPTIYRMEKGKARPHYSTLLKVARALGVPVSHLVELFHRERP